MLSGLKAEQIYCVLKSQVTFLVSDANTKPSTSLDHGSTSITGFFFLVLVLR